MFEKYDYRDKEGKQDGKLLAREFRHFARVWHITEDNGDSGDGIGQLRRRINQHRDEVTEMIASDVRLIDFVEFWYHDLKDGHASHIQDALQSMHEHAHPY